MTHSLTTDAGVCWFFLSVKFATSLLASLAWDHKILSNWTCNGTIPNHVIFIELMKKETFGWLTFPLCLLAVDLQFLTRQRYTNRKDRERNFRKIEKKREKEKEREKGEKKRKK